MYKKWHRLPEGQNTRYEDLWTAISDLKMRDNWSVNGWVRNNWCHIKLSKCSGQKESAEGTAMDDADAAAVAVGDTQI